MSRWQDIILAKVIFMDRDRVEVNLSSQTRTKPDSSHLDCTNVVNKSQRKIWFILPAHGAVAI